MQDLWFKFMTLEFKIRDFIKPRKKIVDEIGLKKGFDVLDYGCGPGGYVPAVSSAIGPQGEVYALDAMPIAIKMVKKLAEDKKLSNVETVLSECSTGLPDGQIDVALLYDVFHDLENEKAVLSELYRVLTPDGTLSFSDHHLKDNEIRARIAGSGLFKLLKKNPLTYSFIKVPTAKYK